MTRRDGPGADRAPHLLRTCEASRSARYLLSRAGFRGTAPPHDARNEEHLPDVRMVWEAP